LLQSFVLTQYYSEDVRNNAGLCALCRLAIYPSIRLWGNTTHRSHLGRFYVAVLIDRMIALCFQANPRIKRVLFVCTPHRGSETALSGLGRFGRSLIALPLAITGTLRESLTDVDLSRFTGSARRLPNSVSGLSPNKPSLKIVNSVTITAPYHSIIGDGEKGDSPDSPRWRCALLELPSRWRKIRTHCSRPTWLLQPGGNDRRT